MLCALKFFLLLLSISQHCNQLVADLVFQVGDVQMFLPYFRQAKLRGLLLSFHLAEVGD